jgi:hypothetical protein
MSGRLRPPQSAARHVPARQRYSAQDGVPPRRLLATINAYNAHANTNARLRHPLVDPAIDDCFCAMKQHLRTHSAYTQQVTKTWCAQAPAHGPWCPGRMTSHSEPLLHKFVALDGIWPSSTQRHYLAACCVTCISVNKARKSLAGFNPRLFVGTPILSAVNPPILWSTCPQLAFYTTPSALQALD